MNYIRTQAIEPVLHKYRQSSYRQRYITPRLLDYTGRHLRRYERAPAVRPMAGYQVLSAEKSSEEADDWVRFFCRPIVTYSNERRKENAEDSQKALYELVELKNPGTHREFLIREEVTNRLVKWEDLPDVDSVREYLKKHPFPKDKCYLEEEFLDEVENGSGEILLCVEKRETAEFIVNLSYELIGEST